MTTGEVLRQALHSQLPPPAAGWLTDACAAAARSSTQLVRYYTEASRRLGHNRFALTDRPQALAEFPFDHWTVEDAGRIVLLLEHHRALPDGFQQAAIACFEQGDTGEQRSWLRACALLPGPAQFLPVVIDACRTSILPIFEAVACENPYPRDYFHDLNFNQLVLKAMFNGIALNRIVGLSGRRNAELSRMSADYAAERTAAGRTVPSDIGLAMANHP